MAISRGYSLLLCLGLIALPIAGCGGGGVGRARVAAPSATPSQGPAPEIAGDADPGDVRVIDAWVTTLRHGDVDAAAGYFAIPSVAENGPLLLHIRSRDDARRFNQSLPCGARLVRAETAGRLHDRHLPAHRAPRARRSAGPAPGRPRRPRS